MYVYQDLEKLGDDEKKRMTFVQSVVNQHKSSRTETREILQHQS